VIAIDTVSAGFRETVLLVSGSSARLAEGCKDRPVDTAIIGIIDSVSIDEGSKGK
jgi:microcompartment protein CcmK/EutM